MKYGVNSQRLIDDVYHLGASFPALAAKEDTYYIQFYTSHDRFDYTHIIMKEYLRNWCV